MEIVRAIKRGERKRLEVKKPDVKVVREKSDLSQAAFAALLGVRPRTLQDWEQGRRRLTGSARSLLRIPDRHPEALRG